MVVLAPRGTAFGSAPRPDAGVDGIQRRAIIQGVAGPHLPQPTRVDLPGGACVLGAAPAALEQARQAQVHKRGHGTGDQHGIQQLEQSIPSAHQGAIDRLATDPQRFALSPVLHASAYRLSLAPVPDSLPVRQ